MINSDDVLKMEGEWYFLVYKKKYLKGGLKVFVEGVMWNNVFCGLERSKVKID